MNLASLRLITDDLGRLVTFYERVTAQKARWLTEDFAELNFPAFTLALGSTRTMALFGLTPSGAEKRYRTIIEFRVTDVDLAYEIVKAHAPSVVQTPTTMPWGNRSMLFHDPDGNLINFFTKPGDRSSVPDGSPSGKVWAPIDLQALTRDKAVA